MSADFRGTRDAIRASKLPGAHKSVLLAMVEYLPNVCPSMAGLSGDTGFSERTVRRAIADLGEWGVLRIDNHPGRRSRYQFTGTFDRVVASRTQANLTAVAMAPVNLTAVAMAAHPGQPDRTTPVTVTYEADKGSRQQADKGAPRAAGAAQPSLFHDSSQIGLRNDGLSNQDSDCRPPAPRGELRAAPDGSRPAAAGSAPLGATSGQARGAKKAKAKLESDPDVLAVFGHWTATLHPRALLDAPRAKAVRRQLDAGRTVADLCKAVDGCAASAWHVENGQTDLELICRDAKRVEMFMGKVDAPRCGDGLVLA